MLMEGVDLPLVASSLAEEDLAEFRLPSPWDKELEPVVVLGQGTFGKVYKCRIICTGEAEYNTAYVSVKLIAKKTAMATCLTDGPWPVALHFFGGLKSMS